MREPEPAPAVREQAVVGEQRLDHVQRQLEPVGFLGVDGEMDVGRAGLERQLAQHRQHRRLGLLGMGAFVARVERRQLDRNARRVARNRPCASLGDAVERVGVGLGVALGVGDRSWPPRRACRSCGSGPASRSGAARFSASSIVRPNTNWRPRIFIAWLTAVRITGSPRRPTARPSAARQLSLRSLAPSSTLPVSSSEKVAALTKVEPDCAELLGPVGPGQFVGDQLVGGLRRRECAAAPRRGTSARCPRRCRGRRRAGRRRARTACARARP